MCHKLEEIQQSFEAYYKDLNTLPDKADDSVIEEFLKSLDLPSIEEHQNNALTAEIITAELGDTVSRVKTNKTPGSDGFVSE